MIYIVLLVLGLCIGSFINALVWRLHKQSELKHAKDKNTYSITKGRSICPNCKHVLAPADLIPVISWLWLRGKCRYCKENISSQYPVVEIITAILFILSYKLWEHRISGIEIYIFTLWLILLAGLISLFIYDLKWQILPNKIVYPLQIIGVLFAILNIFSSTDPLISFYSTVLSVAIGGGVFYLIYQVSKGKWIGGGDVRLGWLLGLIAGTPARSGLAIFIAALAGSLLSIPLLAAKRLKRTSTLPFGPFLITGIILVEFFGEKILNWYFNLVI